MITKRTKEDVVLEFRNYGKITIPKGTKVNHKTATGIDKKYLFVSDFGWIDEKYPEISNILKPDAESYGINIPEEHVELVVQVKFLFSESGYCYDVYKLVGGKPVCRMWEKRGGKEYAAWFTVTDEYEPLGPIKTGLQIEVVDDSGTVLFTESNFKRDESFLAEKQFLFSWEHISIKSDPDNEELYVRLYNK